MSDQEPGYFAIIPADVRYCKALPASAKLLYGELTALAKKEGYCWASNKYFAELYEVDESQIKRWIKALKDEGFILVETSKNGMAWVRKIWVSQRMFAKGQKRPFVENTSNASENASTDTFQRRGKNAPIEGAKMPPYKDTILKEHKQQDVCSPASQCSVSAARQNPQKYIEVLSKLGVHQGVIKKIMETYELEEIFEACKYLGDQVQKKKKKNASQPNLAAYLVNILENKWWVNEKTKEFTNDPDAP